MKRLGGVQRGNPITVDFEGDSLTAYEGEPVACSLLASGERVFSRSIKYHRPRGPYCLAGSCSHCLMRVDGVPNIFTCQTPAQPGMRLERQNAYPSVKVDIFESIDWLFPRGLDHHE
ncbi:MAG TPA: (2Fe-2S)-binding protein, partial [Myxococcaceae bacterium]|nr:(2Fe-2S)-binding protein [Myxococcaceae bacterium]